MVFATAVDLDVVEKDCVFFSTCTGYLDATVANQGKDGCKASDDECVQGVTLFLGYGVITIRLSQLPFGCFHKQIQKTNGYHQYGNNLQEITGFSFHLSSPLSDKY